MKFIKYFILFSLIIATCILTVSFLYISKNIDYERDEMLFRNSNHTSVITLYVNKNGVSKEDMENYEPIVREEVCYTDLENKWVSIENVPKTLIEAFICTEDRMFYEHNGVNIPRTVKAVLNHFFKGGKRFGGSTLTQQVIKNISGDNEFTIRRKVDEILRAYSLERRHSKREILEMYLNIIPMGDRLIGVQSASENYFGKDVSQLSTAECATLVAITNAPSRYHPIRHPVETKKKRDIVLSSMLSCGYISDDEYRSAIQEEISTVEKSHSSETTVSWFGEMVIEQVREDLLKRGMSEQAISFLFSNGGLQIYTTEDVTATKAIEEIFYDEEVQRGFIEDELDCAMLITNNETGQIAAVIGNGRRKTANKLLNLATDTPHTPGSSLKPLALYAPLIDENLIHWGSVYDDVPLEFIQTNDGYRVYPNNLPKRYDGLTTVKDAIKYSKNTIAIRMYDLFGKERIYSQLTEKYRFAHILRSKQLHDGTLLTDLAPSPLALGQLSYGVTLKELTDAYASFPRDGVFGISKGYVAVYDKDGNLIIENTQENERIFKKETARIMNQLLSEVVNGGTAKSITLTKSVDTAGKTGTSGEDKDRLFVGYTPYYTAGIWISKKDASLSIGKTKVSHLLLWNEVMKLLHKDIILDENPRSFSTGGLIRCKYCLDSGCAPSEKCKMDLRGERIAQGYFTMDNMPRKTCESHFTVLYDALCNAIASPNCVSDGEVREVSLVKLPERIFPIEVTITDAEYMGIETLQSEKRPDSYEFPYFYYELPEGVYVGKSKEKKQKNSYCYFHSD